jgi:hypothetical protein
MNRRRGAAAISVAVALAVSSCGTYVPPIQEYGLDKVAGQQLVQSIVYNVTCEVRDAIDKLYYDPDHFRKHTFLDTWGVQIALSIQVEEKSNVSPLANVTPPGASTVFNLIVGGTASADATRQEKTNSYFTISQIRALGPCNPADRPGGLLLLQSDLGLEDWLRANLIASDTGKIRFATDYTDGPLGTNVLSHEIKFDITNGGNLSPGWVLRAVSIDQGNNLLSATRDRTNDLTITLGPTLPMPKTTKDKNGQLVTVTRFGPAAAAQEAALASQIGLAVSNAIKGTLRPTAQPLFVP